MQVSSFHPVLSSPKPGLQNLHAHRPQETEAQPAKGAGLDTDISPQKIVDLKVGGALEKLLKNDGISLTGLDPEDFSPQAVSDRILSSVRQAYGQFQQNRPGGDDGEFFSQVREGLKQGFAEARDILQNLGVLKGQIAADIDHTRDLTLRGLEQFESVGVNMVTDMAFQSISLQSSRSAQLRIETQQGDLITLSFNQSTSASRSAVQASRTGQALNVFRQSESFERDLNITLEGDLNSDEQNALRQLMQNMHKISNAFFHGNAQAALKHAMKVGFDSEQIAGFSLDLNMRKSLQAVAAYQQTAQPEQTIGSNLLTQAGEFLEAAKTLLADAQSGLRNLLEPSQAFNDLFNEIGTLSRENGAGPNAADENLLFADIIAALGMVVFGDKAEQEQTV